MDTTNLNEQATKKAMETLIFEPIIAAAKGQQELTEVNYDMLMKLAYKEGKAEGEKCSEDENGSSSNHR